MRVLWWILVAVGAVGAAVAVIRRFVRTALRQAQYARAQRDFHIQRERLEAKFVQLASVHAGPDGPHWDDCDFADDVIYVRTRKTGKLSALVSMTVAVDDVEGPPAAIGDLVGNLRAGTAVFRFESDHWETDGRALLNLSPIEALRRYRDDLEMVDHEPAGR